MTTSPVRPADDPQTHPATDPDQPDVAPRPGEADPSEPQPVVAPEPPQHAPD
jgi:hypothetical protein